MHKVLLAPDHAKAFGISLVVFGHTLRGLFTSGILPQNEFWSAVDATIYLFHMPLFFYISGLFIQSSIDHYGYDSFVKRTAFLLLVPMVVWSYLQFSLQYMAGTYSNARPDLYDLITAPIPPRQQFWFLGSLFIMMAGTGFLISRSILNKIIWPLTGILFLIQFLIWDSAVSYMVGKPWAHLLLSTLLFWPYFLLAIAFGTQKMASLNIGTSFCILTFLSALALYQIAESLQVLLALICVLAVYKIALNIESGRYADGKISRFVAFIGMNSMMIYLAHIIFAAGFRVALNRFGIEAGNIHLLCGFMAGMIGPLLLIPVGLMAGKYFPSLARAVFPVREKRND